jgi:DNA-nicking Smr family endonuclease
MRANKKGLADLKRLRQAAEAGAAASAGQPAPAGRKPTAARSKRRTQGRPLQEPKQTATQAAAPAPVVAEPAAIALDTSDVALFRRAVKSVTPIKNTRRAILPPVPMASAVILRQRRSLATGQATVKLAAVSDQYTPAQLSPDASHFVQSGCGPDLAKDLKRGKWPVGASLDLHGATLEQARARLDQFLQSCITHQIRCVQIVHGKGYGSKDGAPVLKQTVRRWLTQLAAVQAYVECSEQNGGAGAVQVLLRTPAPPGLMRKKHA